MDKTIRIAVCDDDAKMSDSIRTMTADFFRGKNMDAKILQFSCGEQLLNYDKNIDILFLDIQMHGIDGMDTARRLRERRFKGFLIFITVLKEMVFQAFEVQAYDYLLKPVEQTHFQRTMERLLASVQKTAEANLLIQKGHERHIISLEDIVYFEIFDRKVFVHLASSEIIDFYERIENLENKLDDRFFRCHRSFLIHLKYLKSYKEGIAYMEGGKELPVSRLRRKEFSGAVLQYMKNM